MPGKVLKTIYFLKGSNADESNLMLLVLEKQKGNNSFGINVHFLYIIYAKTKVTEKFSPLILSPKSHISVISASRPFRKYKVHHTYPVI